MKPLNWLQRRIRSWLGVEEDLAHVLVGLTRVEGETRVAANKAGYAVDKLNRGS